jgi:hypothetical protein
MAGIFNPGRQRSAFTRGIAWLILIIWAGWWIFFNVASGIGEFAELGLMGLVMHLIMPIVILVLLWICWRWELIGGILLIVAALVFFYLVLDNAQPGPHPLLQDFMFLTLVLPTVFSGVLLILCGIISCVGRPRQEPPGPTTPEPPGAPAAG